ncbi:LOW QUALITY PROTEIN: hypothetical protein HID58_005236 [Brassica napus]|uniref:Uncharacterized protein n=1 Tax=Brassica napus TaxID=3708 RepID=A0ABQ8E821_BRANA|nr:LOW QUALITY PROTEIN: hypothetical protein HID58_005236 [Brassica napus]
MPDHLLIAREKREKKSRSPCGSGERPARLRACRRRNRGFCRIKALLRHLLRIPPIFALSDLWLRPNPWCMVVVCVELGRGSGKVLDGGEAARLDQDSGRWRLFLLRRRRFCFREGEAYLAPSSPSCLRRVEATVAPCCRFGTRRKFGC